MTFTKHGITVLEVTEGTRPIATIPTAVIGLAATGDDADATFFPENEAVLVTDVQAAIGKAGDTGTLPYSLDAIANQGNALTFLVRVPEGADEAETTANVIGTTVNGHNTGLKALTTVKAQHGFGPRILGAPGLDTQAVADEMVAMSQAMRAFTYAAAWGCEDRDAAAAYANNFGAREIMIMWPDFLSFDTITAQTQTAYATARALGLRAKIDHEIGWNKTISNVPVNGVQGISKDVSWELQGVAHDAHVLNGSNVTTLINHKGFRFWGSRTCTAEPKFMFESATRTAQILADTMAEAHFWAMDKRMNRTLVRDMVDGINAKFREFVANDYLIGGEAWFDPAKNTVEQLEAGKLSISYDYTPTPPLEDLTFIQKITNDYLYDFQSSLAG